MDKNNWKDGLLVYKDYLIAGRKTLVETVTIPNNIKYIAGYAFNECENILNVVLPEGLEHIGKFAFAGCNTLESINLDEISIKTIEAYAFSNCSSLISVNFSKNLVSIGRSAFEYCSQLKEIHFVGESMCEIIGNNAFYFCQELKHINIPGSVANVGNYAFYQCKIERIDIDSIESWNNIVWGIDSLNPTNVNEIKLFINGIQVGVL